MFSHKVKDFDTWMTEFINHSEFRQNAGSQGVTVLQAPNDPNQVTVIGRFTSEEEMNKFAQSPDLHAIMEKAGVLEEPTVQVYNEAGSYDN